MISNMNFQINIFSFLSLSIVILGKNLRIIGGQDADIRNFPYIVSLKYGVQKYHLCSGAIITNQHIITAAHCLEKRSKFKMSLYTGTAKLNNFSLQIYTITDIKIHPEFFIDKSVMQIENDIAILTVEPPIVFNQFQNKIDLPIHDVQPGDSAMVSGWGWTSYPTGELSQILQYTVMHIISNDDCELSYPNIINKQHLCAFQREEIGVCFGDSGGSLVSNGKLIGILSFTYPCAEGDADIYTRVYFHLDFIKSNTANLDIS